MNCLAYSSLPPLRPTHHRRKVLAVSKLELSLKHFFTWTNQDFYIKKIIVTVPCVMNDYGHVVLSDVKLMRQYFSFTISVANTGERYCCPGYSAVFFKSLSGHIANRDKQLQEADQDGGYWSSSSLPRISSILQMERSRARKKKRLVEGRRGVRTQNFWIAVQDSNNRTED